MTALRAGLVTDAAELWRLEPAWWRLFARCPAAAPFAAPAWILPWWRAFAPGPLRAVAAWRGPDLVALAPLYLEEASRRLLPLGIGVSDEMDLLAAPDADPDLGPALMGALARSDGWDAVSFEELPPGGAALGLALPPGWSDEVAPQGRRPVLRWGAGGPAGAVPAGQRRKLRMARHRTERRGGVVELAAPGTMGEHVEALIRLHAARWAARGESGVLAHSAVQRFHREAAPRLLEAGLLHGTLLRIDGRVAGAFHGLRRGSTIRAYLGGFDPDFAFESPGTVLMGHAIDAAARDGAGALDFLRGAEPYKYGWGAIDEPNSRRLLRRPAR